LFGNGRKIKNGAPAGILNFILEFLRVTGFREEIESNGPARTLGQFQSSL
jgi:hypothetical protein